MIYRCFFWLACYFSLNVAAFCNPIVQINSSLGDFKIELFDEVAPVTVNNFLNYVESKRYNGTLIHRSVPSFVIQGGWLSFQSEINALVSIETDDHSSLVSKTTAFWDLNVCCDFGPAVLFR